jgi:hypothetical protein
MYCYMLFCRMSCDLCLLHQCISLFPRFDARTVAKVKGRMSCLWFILRCCLMFLFSYHGLNPLASSGLELILRQSIFRHFGRRIGPSHGLYLYTTTQNSVTCPWYKRISRRHLSVLASETVRAGCPMDVADTLPATYRRGTWRSCVWVLL